MSIRPSDAKPPAPEPTPTWKARARAFLESTTLDLDEAIDAAHRRARDRFGWGRAKHIAAFRALCDSTGATLQGRVLASEPLGGPKESDDWWDNLLSTYRRLESDEVPGAALKVEFLGRAIEVVTDDEGYYRARIDVAPREWPDLWADAMVALADGSLATLQPVLTVPASARIGIISDIDDTVLESSILHWRTAAQLTFLHNARTRKPLPGVAKLYQALQAGADGRRRNPVFYVSSSPWNLYDLLEDFLELNAIPFGPIFLRDIGMDEGKFIKTTGHGHKLERARELIARYPSLRWVLLGDSGQADAELYAEAAGEFGDRILAIYIRDVDPSNPDAREAFVDEHIRAIDGTKVPMLRVSDSFAIAEHALGLGLLAEATLDDIAKEAQRDRARPTLPEAAAAEAKEKVVEGDVSRGAPEAREPG